MIPLPILVYKSVFFRGYNAKEEAENKAKTANTAKHL